MLSVVSVRKKLMSKRIDWRGIWLLQIQWPVKLLWEIFEMRPEPQKGERCKDLGGEYYKRESPKARSFLNSNSSKQTSVYRAGWAQEKTAGYEALEVSRSLITKVLIATGKLWLGFSNHNVRPVGEFALWRHVIWFSFLKDNSGCFVK